MRHILSLKYLKVLKGKFKCKKNSAKNVLVFWKENISGG